VNFQKIGGIVALIFALVSGTYTGVTSVLDYVGQTYLSRNDFVIYAVNTITFSWNIQIDRIHKELIYERSLKIRDEKRIQFLEAQLKEVKANMDYYYQTGHFKIGELIVNPNEKGVLRLFQ